MLAPHWDEIFPRKLSMRFNRGQGGPVKIIFQISCDPSAPELASSLTSHSFKRRRDLRMASCEWTPASQRGQAFQREDTLDNTAVCDPATAGVKSAGGCCAPAAGLASGGVKRRAGSPHTLHCLLLFAAAPLACATGAFTCTVQDASCAALGDLFYATAGPAWNNNFGWTLAASGARAAFKRFPCAAPIFFQIFVWLVCSTRIQGRR